MIFMITSILYNTTWTLLFTFNVAYSRFKTFKILSYQTSDINFFLTQGRDVHPLLRLRHCYPTLPNYCFMSTTTTTTTTTTITTTAQLNNLPLTAIIFIIIDGTIRSNNHKKNKHTQLVQYVSFEEASNETLTFYFRFEMHNILFLEHTCTA